MENIYIIVSPDTDSLEYTYYLNKATLIDYDNYDKNIDIMYKLDKSRICYQLINYKTESEKNKSSNLIATDYLNNLLVKSCEKRREKIIALNVR